RETRLAHRTVGGDEGRDAVPRAIGGGVADLRVREGTRAADGRLGAAGGATARVVARPPADAFLAGDRAGDGGDLLAARLAVVEEGQDCGGVIGEHRGE